MEFRKMIASYIEVGVKKFENKFFEQQFLLKFYCNN